MLETRQALAREKSSGTEAEHLERAAEHERNAKLASGIAKEYRDWGDALNELSIGGAMIGAGASHPGVKALALGTALGLQVGAAAANRTAKNAQDRAEAEATKAEQERRKAAEAKAARDRAAKEQAVREAREWQAWHDRESRMTQREKVERTERILEGQRRSAVC